MKDVINHFTLQTISYSLAFLLAGFILATLAKRASFKALSKTALKPRANGFSRLFFYLIITGFILAALNQLGFKISMLVGITGLLTVAMGFAAQSSMANVISGLFLILEKPFRRGDNVKIAGETGQVEAVDLLSVQVRLPNNTLVRLPNEMVFKSAIINYSKCNRRRVDINVDFAAETSLLALRDWLIQLATDEACMLKDPEPSITILEINAVRLNVRLSVWCNRTEFTNATQALFTAIDKASQTQLFALAVPYPLQG